MKKEKLEGKSSKDWLEMDLEVLEAEYQGRKITIQRIRYDKTK
jgi:hypothetical protein